MSMKLNPDKEKRREVAQAVVANDGYCPCLIVRNEDTKCPCKAMREEGRCICGLYVNVEEDKKEIDRPDYFIYGNRMCCQCKICARKLANKGIKFETKYIEDLDTDQSNEILRIATEKNIKAYPIVINCKTGEVVEDWRLL